MKTRPSRPIGFRTTDHSDPIHTIPWGAWIGPIHAFGRPNVPDLPRWGLDSYRGEPGYFYRCVLVGPVGVSIGWTRRQGDRRG